MFRFLNLVVAAFLVLPGAWAYAQGKSFETTKVAQNVYSFRAYFHRTLFLVTNDGVIVADPISVQAARRMDAEIKKVTNKPVKYVVYSHNHGDHVTGAKVFKDQGAQIISQARCVAHFKRNPSPDTPIPDISFEDRHELKLGGETVRLYYFGPSHSDCLSFMLLPRQKLLFVVDIGGAKRLPYRDFPSTDPMKAIFVLKQLEALQGYDRVIPGHGPPTTPRNVLTQNRQYMEDLMTTVKRAVGQGMPVDQAVREIKLPKYQDFGSYGSWLPLNIQGAYRYLQKER
jgi:glyoxylase-like metal-dependent hydrolase (beta-lactamase superfamily II)